MSHRHPISRTSGGGLLTALLCMALVGCDSSGNADTPGQASRPPTAVIVAPVTSETFADSVEALGTAHASESIVLTSNIAEKITAIEFTDGADVAQGDVVVRLDTSAEAAALQAAQARLDERQKSLSRIRGLHEKRIVSDAERDLAAAEVATARAEVAALQAQIADRIIRAPFAGRLGLRSVSVGTLIQPGQPITTLDALSTVKVDFTVPAVHLSLLQPGLPLQARTATWPDRVFRGELASAATQVDPLTRTVTARALLPNPEGLLRPGMLVNLTLLSNERQSPAIPEAALMPLGEQQFVFVLTPDNTVRRTEVQIGTRHVGQVEIRAGLEPGQRVVVHGTLKVSDGGPVEVMAELDGSRSIAEILRDRNGAKPPAAGTP